MFACTQLHSSLYRGLPTKISQKLSVLPADSKISCAIKKQFKSCSVSSLLQAQENKKETLSQRLSLKKTPPALPLKHQVFSAEGKANTVKARHVIKLNNTLLQTGNREVNQQQAQQESSETQKLVPIPPPPLPVMKNTVSTKGEILAQITQEEADRFVSQIADDGYVLNFEGFHFPSTECHNQVFRYNPEMMNKAFQTLPFAASIRRLSCDMLLDHIFPPIDFRMAPIDIEWELIRNFRKMASSLVNFMEEGKPIIVFGKSFEVNVFDLLKLFSPELEEPLEKRKRQIVDLQLPFQRCLAGGGFSLKALESEVITDCKVPYRHLFVSQGRQASKVYYHLAQSPQIEHSWRMRALQEYCAHDTWVIIQILKKLQSKAGNLQKQVAESHQPTRIILIDDPNTQRPLMEALLSSNKHRIDLQSCKIICVDEKHPWNVNFLEGQKKPEILLLFNNPGYQEEPKKKLVNFVQYFLAKNYRVKVNIPYGEHAESAMCFDQLPLKRRASKIASLIANAILIKRIKPLLPTQVSLARSLQKMISANVPQDFLIKTKRRETITSRAASAISILQHAKKIVWPPPDWSNINQDVLTLKEYYRRWRGLTLPLPPTVLFAHVSHPDLSPKSKYLASIFAYGRSWHQRIEEYTDQPLMKMIKEHDSMKNFLFRYQDIKGVIDVDQRSENAILLVLHDVDHEIKIALNKSGEVLTVHIQDEEIKDPTSIRISSLTQIHRIYHGADGKKLHLKVGGKPIRTKCLRGYSPGSFWLAHIEGEPVTIFGLEGPEEAMVEREALVQLPYLRKHYGIENGNFAIISSHEIADVIFPKCTKRVILGIDNDGINPDIMKAKRRVFQQLKDKGLNVHAVVADSALSGEIIDLNDLLLREGIDAVGQALLKNTEIASCFFEDLEFPFEDRFTYEHICQKIEREGSTPELCLQAGRLASSINKLPLALQHLDEGLSQLQHSQYSLYLIHLLLVKSRVLARQKQLEEAKEVLQFAIAHPMVKTKTQEHLLQIALGDVLFRMGQKEQSFEIYQDLSEEISVPMDVKAQLFYRMGLVQNQEHWLKVSLTCWESINKNYDNSKQGIEEKHQLLGEVITRKLCTRLFVEKQNPKQALLEYKKCVKILKNLYKTSYRWEIVDLQKRMAEIATEEDPLQAIFLFRENIKRVLFLDPLKNHVLVETQLKSIYAIFQRIYSDQLEKQWLDLCENVGVTADLRKSIPSYFEKKSYNIDRD